MRNWVGHVAGLALMLAVLLLLVGLWVHGATRRVVEARTALDGDASVAVASAADVGYCTAELKTILRRVLTSCGLVQGGGQRGCQPLDAKRVAAMTGGDFNALFVPMAERAAILQFERDSSDLDEPALTLLDSTFSDQRGASYFLVVARASPEGSTEHNTRLSEGRANAVLQHLKTKFTDPDLEQEVGLLWLGEEFAQLDTQYCQWRRSTPDGPCDSTQLNRSAFVAWIDCRL